MKREEVYKQIDAERERQNEIWGHDSDSKTIGSHITFIDTYLHAAKDGFTYTNGNRKSLDAIRRIAALAVRCLEIHETPVKESAAI